MTYRQTKANRAIKADRQTKKDKDVCNFFAISLMNIFKFYPFGTSSGQFMDNSRTSQRQLRTLLDNIGTNLGQHMNNSGNTENFCGIFLDILRLSHGIVIYGTLATLCDA